MLLEKQGSTTTATYTYGNALIRKDGETPLFDGLGSERTVTNSSQAVTASLTLSAFGQTIASSGSSTSAYGFGATSGYRSDGDAGLTLVGCRYYDAQVGRFITRDTYLDQAPYAYCDGDPINCTDPSGHAKKMPIWKQILHGIGMGFAGLNPTGTGGPELIPETSVQESQTQNPSGGGGTGGGSTGGGSTGGGGGGGTNLLIGSGVVAVGIVIVGLALAPETGGASLVLLAAA